MAEDFLLKIQPIKGEVESDNLDQIEPGINQPISRGISETESFVEAAPNSDIFTELRDQTYSPPANTPLTDVSRASEYTPITAGDYSKPIPGKIDWDAILQIRQELMKDNPDWQSIFQTLNNLNMKDRTATLTEMQKDGNLTTFIHKLPPEAHQALADFLKPLFSDQHVAGLEQLQDVLQSVLNVMNDGTGEFADTVRTLAEGKIFAHQFQEAKAMVEILNDDPAAEHRLCDLLAMKNLEEEHPQGIFFQDGYDRSPEELNQMIDTYFANFLNGTQEISAPGLAEAFKEFPAWGTQELIQLSKSGQMDTFVTQLLKSGNDISAGLGKGIFQTYQPDAAAAYDNFLQALMNSKNPAADDLVREIVANATDSNNAYQFELFYPEQNDPVDSLSRLPVSILIDMKLILQNGDNPDLNAESLDLVNSAYDVAKAR